ncbi:myb-like protein X isoform X2 [Cyclopterus lumpus]|nr:myb-like protein X isoform X2 [Cyclopterus lumpus]
MECSVRQGTISSPKDELPTKVKQNEHFNLSEVVGAHHSQDAVNKVHGNDIKLMIMHEVAYSSDSRMHDATENSEISGNLMNQTGVCETNQSELIVKSIHDSSTNQDENVEALEWNNENYCVYDTNSEYHSEVAVNKLHEQDVEPKENQEMPQLDYSSENVIHNATENSEIISGNLMNQTEVSDTFQYTLTVKNTDDSPTNRDNSNPDNIQDEHPTEENHFEVPEQKNNVHVYESKEPLISDIERLDTALSQVFEIEGRVEDDTKPSAEQTGQQEQEGLLSEMEESASSLQTLQSEINVPFDSQPQPKDTSFNSSGNRRKLGSSRRNKRRHHVKDSVAESDHEPTEDVVGNISDNDTLETTEMTLTTETAVQEKSMETFLEGTDTFDTAQTEDVSDPVKENAQDGTLVGIANLNSSGLQSSSTVDQQTIEQSIFREMPDEEVPNVCSVTEKENKGIDENTDRFRQDGKLQGKYLVSQDLESSITPEITTEKHSSREHTEPECSFEQEIYSSPKEELHGNEGQNKIFNLPKVKGDYHSEVAVNKLHEQDVEPKENQEMPQLDYSSENVIHNATENSEIISGNPMNQTEVSDTFQYTLTVKNTDDSPTNRDNSNPDNIQDEHPTEENHFEVPEQKNNVHVYESKEPLISDIERVDTALSQVFEIEGRVEDDTKPSAEQTGQQEQEGLLSETEESASSLQTLQSEINVPFDSQPQPKDTSFNSSGNRRKLGSSRRNKRRHHVKDSVAESDHEPTEDVVGNFSDNDTLETTEMTLTTETAVKEKSIEEVPNVCSVAENEERNKYTDRFRQDENVHGKYLVIESHVKSEDIESSITLEISTEESSPEERNEIKCSVEQAEFSSSEENLRNINEEQKEHVNLSQVRGTWHSQDAVNKGHEEEIKPTDMQEIHQTDNLSIDSESNLQEFQSEINAPLDSQPLENSENIKEQTYKDFNPTGNRTKLGSSQRNGQLHVKDATQMSLVMETMRQEEIKEGTDLNAKSAGEMRKNRSTVNDKENAEKMSEDDIILPKNVMCNNTVVTTDITSSSGKDDSVKSNKKVTEKENVLIKETEDLGQRAGCDTFKMNLIQSQEVLVWKDNSDIESSSYHYDVTARSNTSDEAFHVQNTEASHFDYSETIMQQTNETSETDGNVTMKYVKTGAESTKYVQVHEQDEDGAQFEDPTKKENEAQEINVSKEMFSAPHNNTDTLATFDIGLEDENLRAEPVVDVSEESGISSQQGIQENTNLQRRSNQSKQKRRKMGSTRRTQLNSKPEEKRVETETSDREADKMEVEELTIIATAEVSQNETAKPSLSLVYKEQMETDETSTVDGMGQKLQSSGLQSNMMSDLDYSKALPPEQSGSHNEDVVDPVKFVHAADVSDRKRNVDVSVEPSQIDETHITSASTGRTPINEERPENVNIIQDQALKSTEALVLADLEIVKSVVKEGAGVGHITAGASKQEPDIANEGAYNKNLEMKNASSYLETSSRRRKMGSTRRNLRTGSKQEDLHQKQDVNDEATESATNVGDVRTESFSSIMNDELQLDGKHKDGGSETIEYSHTGESHKPLAHQTFEENPVSQGQLVETEHQLTPSYLPAMPSTSPKHDLISESASGGRRRKMGSHRKSHGHQDPDNQTARRDRITDTQHERDVRSIREESAIKTEELREEYLGLDKISKVDKSHKKPFSNLSTTKEGEHPRPVSEKTPESVTPLQHHYAESQHKLSLVSRADLRSNAYNVMMVGDSSVGKTSFMRRAQSGKFSSDIPASIGLDSCMWTVIVEGKPVVLQLWDTAGQERFHSITRQVFHKAHAFLLMYDVTSSQSFSAVSYWASCIQEGAAESVTILLVGNKSDRAECQVKTQEAEILAKEYNIEYMECSAATGENVVQCLETVARMLSQKVDLRDDTMVLHKEPQTKTSRCC